MTLKDLSESPVDEGLDSRPHVINDCSNPDKFGHAITCHSLQIVQR